MATNVKHDTGANVRMELTVGASKTSGSVLLLNSMPVFLLGDSDSNNKAVCVIPSQLVVNLSVKGADGSGNAAVAVGNKIYNDSGEYNRDVTNGVWIGYALAAVSSGATTEIAVALVAS